MLLIILLGTIIIKNIYSKWIYWIFVFFFLYFTMRIIYSAENWQYQLGIILVHVAESKYKNQYTSMVMNIYILSFWSTYASYEKKILTTSFTTFPFAKYKTDMNIKKKNKYISKKKNRYSCFEIFIPLIFSFLSICQVSILIYQ